jgi:hypothetical protein
MAHLQRRQGQPKAPYPWQRGDAPTRDIRSCMPHKRGRESEQSSDSESFIDTSSSDDGDSGSEFDGVSTPEENSENISGVGAEFRQIIQMHKKQGPSNANHAPKTRQAIETGKAYFEEYASTQCIQKYAVYFYHDRNTLQYLLIQYHDL